MESKKRKKSGSWGKVVGDWNLKRKGTLIQSTFLKEKV